MKLLELLFLSTLLLHATSIAPMNISITGSVFNYLNATANFAKNSANNAWQFAKDYPCITAGIMIGIYIPLVVYKLYRSYKPRVVYTPAAPTFVKTAHANANITTQQQLTEKKLLKDRNKINKRKLIELLVRFVTKNHFNENKFEKKLMNVSIMNYKIDKMNKIILRIKKLFNAQKPENLSTLKNKINIVAQLIHIAPPF